MGGEGGNLESECMGIKSGLDKLGDFFFTTLDQEVEMNFSNGEPLE